MLILKKGKVIFWKGVKYVAVTSEEFRGCHKCDFYWAGPCLKAPCVAWRCTYERA